MSPSRLVVVGASLGGVQALQTLASMLPADFAAPLLVVLHIGSHRSILPQLLSARGPLPAAHAADGEPLAPGRILVAPPDRHLLVRDGRVHLDPGPKEHFSRPAIDPLFRSAALSHGPGVVGVVLTGLLDDGTNGLQVIKACGGVAVVQDPADAFEPSMPQSALRYVEVDHCVRLDELAGTLAQLLAAPRGHAGPGEPAPEAHAAHELDLLLARGDPMKHLEAIGSPSTFVCPECRGSLWVIQGAQPHRYRCHTGHAFTLRTLEHAQSIATGEALWTAVRALQEKEKLMEQVALQRRAEGDAREAERLEAGARAIAQQAGVLRRLIETGPPEED